MHKLLAVAAAALFTTSAGAAFAGGAAGGGGGVVTLDVACNKTDISPTASACAGWFDGNLNQGSPSTDTLTALNDLLGAGTYASVSQIKVLASLPSLGGLPAGSTVNFGVPLYGETVVSFHVGKAKGAPGSVGYDSTAFFEFNAGDLPGGLQSITFERAGLSNAQLYSTGTYQPPAVPEPATWAMMILGAGMIGFAARRRSQGAAAAA